MKVYVRPQRPLSRAMDRVADALERHAPPWVEIADDADLQVLHVVGNGQDALARLRAPRYAVIQYCHQTAAEPEGLPPLWAGAEIVWSYLPSVPGTYFAPLGIDPSFLSDFTEGERDLGIMTSGYVSGPTAEAIEEAVMAAERAGLTSLHLGPRRVEGMIERPFMWNTTEGIDDYRLASLYRRTRWVSGLRHVEGFELPCIEGLACGARPIVFDRPDMRQWYGDFAVYVPECSGRELVDRLTVILSEPPQPVNEEERRRVLGRFHWPTIVEGFWGALASRMREVA